MKFITGQRRKNWCEGFLALLATPLIGMAAPSVVSDHDAYYPGEDILIHFAGGPGGTKDWIGIYPSDIVPGTVGSTLWYYVDGTKSGSIGVQEGTITFSGGLSLAGDWASYLLLNDGYTIAATNLFSIVDPSSPLVRPASRTFAPGQAITISFTNGPANPADWIGVYKLGQTPGSVASTIWNYVGGTHGTGAALSSGVVSFPNGLTATGDYIAYFLENDGYNVLASETFSVASPSVSGLRYLTLYPTDGAANQPPLLRFAASITNGTAPVSTNSIVLTLDGTPVPPVVTQLGGLTTVTYTNTGALPLPNSAHTWVFSIRDTATPANTLSNQLHVTIGTYRDIVLPQPFFFENFDSTPEGEIPAGWTGKSYSVINNTDEDFGNLDSATFGRWTTIAADRFNNPFITYSDPNSSSTDYRRVLSSNPFNVVNGQVISGPLGTGRILFGDSGYRTGRSQVLYVSTPDVNLTGRSNVFLSFHSLWEQNQDSIATIEYSIDQGSNWLPVAYYLDGPDIAYTTNGAGDQVVDVDTTLNTYHGDVAIYTDDDGNDVGGTYGSFVGAPITEALAPFIEARVDDNPVESKRVELYPLPLAANQSTVRVRFGHAGTDSWYFGVDDLGLYSIAPVAPHLSISLQDGMVHLAWPSDATGYILEQASLVTGGVWQAVPGVTGSSVSLPVTGSQEWYRLRQP